MPSGIFTLKQQELALGQGAWTNQPPNAVNYLVVAGGGAGSNGAGGAGGLLQGSLPIAAGTSFTVTIGAGGTQPAGNGNNSVFGSITAIAGGGGTNGDANGKAGGSGGGAGFGTWSPGQGTFGQGSTGGIGAGSSGTDRHGGGGGGAGTIGLNATTSLGGAGGAGVASDISGVRTTYAGGGGGGGGVAGGAGGAGGGGAGSTGSGASGSSNTGGGGGGGYATGGGNGGSGVVIVSYPDTYAAPASTTGSPTVSTSGSGSLYLDGSGDWLTVSSNAAFGYGTGNFTIEFWVNTATNTGAQTILSSLTSASSVNPHIYLNSGALIYYTNNADRITGSTLTIGVWYHVAVCRSGTSTRMFINGTQSGSTYTDSNDYGSSAPLGVGTYFSGGSPVASSTLNGYISNIRILKGTALYTANFTAPAAPLTAITNTQALFNAVSGSQFADSSANSFAPSVAGNTAWNQLSPFATGLGYKNRVYTWTSSGSITF